MNTDEFFLLDQLLLGLLFGELTSSLPKSCNRDFIDQVLRSQQSSSCVNIKKPNILIWFPLFANGLNKL